MAAAIIWSAIATATLLIGMWLAYRGLVSPRWTALIMAFGAGAIVSAVSYQLVLGAVLGEPGNHVLVGLGITVGALTFYFADRWVDGMGGKDRLDFDGAQADGSGVGILLGSLLDGVPESLVLGISLVHSTSVSLAFVFAVAISNIPQGLGGTAGMLSAGWIKRDITRLWLAVCVLSVIAAAIGFAVASVISNFSAGFFELFAAGALLVMLTDFDDPRIVRARRRRGRLGSGLRLRGRGRGLATPVRPAPGQPGMSAVRTVIDRGPKGKRSVAFALDWPGWSRGAKTPELARETLESYRKRYQPVSALAGMGREFETTGSLEIVEDKVGTGSTDFWGISFSPSSTERDPMGDTDFERKIALLRASWAFFDAVAARVSPEMRKGPRGGGRERDEIIRHVIRTESQDFAKGVGLVIPDGEALIPDGLAEYRDAYVEQMRAYNAGEVKKRMRSLTLPFLIRHSAFHTLDHAWEMEDKDLSAHW